jgi:hypothetical protein
MAEDNKRGDLVQINFRANRDLKSRFEDAVYANEIRTRRRRLTINTVLVELVEDFIAQEEKLKPS